MADKVKPSASVKVDPFSPKNAFTVLGRLSGDAESPNGYVINWVSEKLRNSGVTGGWKGYQVVKWDHPRIDEILALVASAPMRMSDGEKIDQVVRRADSVLATINADWWDARQNDSAKESRERVAGLTIEEGVEILPGVETFGGGRKPDKNPTFGGKPMDSALAAKLRNN